MCIRDSYHIHRHCRKHRHRQDDGEDPFGLSLRKRDVYKRQLYNDSIVAQIVKRFQKQDAIVIYVPDHGEECYEENRGFICRNHSAETVSYTHLDVYKRQALYPTFILIINYKLLTIT